MVKSLVTSTHIKKVNTNGIIDSDDLLATEEPLEIRLGFGSQHARQQQSISVTMRTPGNEAELAAGFLFTEGIIRSDKAIDEIKFLAFDDNKIVVTLKENIVPVLNNAARNFYTTSSCGICGKASIEAITVAAIFPGTIDTISVQAAVLHSLSDLVKDEQKMFQHTGGIHAAALFNLKGNLLMVREDVGRHNALDKIIGAALLKNELPLHESILFLSGRASFELIQKAFMAGIKIVVAVGAPSSLAIEMAVESGITLIGFLKQNSLNIYTAKERILQ